MTQTSEPTTVKIQARSRKTEMGFEVQAISKAAIVTVEIDLDHDPEQLVALLAIMPQIISDQVVKHLEEGEEDTG